METYTIDSKKTRCRDDALSWQIGEESSKLVVHITDPTILIEQDSLYDKEAHSKVTKVDIGDFHMPMLPTFITY